MNLTVTVRGLEELKREMQRLTAAAQGRLARNASMAMARVVAKHARANAPVLTGELKANIKARRPRNKQLRGVAVAYANSAARHSHLVEYGTAHSAAKPYLRPALDEHVTEVHAKLIENLSNGLQREIRKQQIAEDPGEI